MRYKALLIILQKLLKVVEKQEFEVKIDDNKQFYSIDKNNVESVLKELYTRDRSNLYLTLTKRFSIRELN
ncbi:hypothetical protein [Carboxylicivirga caseinilyticus]|uniref:hypothetical protein n=1 Tax=Carboxylicivirga caseinilyticus TaxID=3417572 RepID=UPI003D345853|nr:hypothetical protein [Marinilabiliaceae bacterium A049]